jgi:two-component system response regulator RegA
MTNPIADTQPVMITAATLAERSLLIVEDDKSFLQRLARAMETRGFAVSTAESVADGLLQVEKAPPAFAVVDMRLADGNAGPMLGPSFSPVTAISRPP